MAYVTDTQAERKEMKMNEPRTPTEINKDFEKAQHIMWAAVTEIGYIASGLEAACIPTGHAILEHLETLTRGILATGEVYGELENLWLHDVQQSSNTLHKGIIDLAIYFGNEEKKDA
jgi:hypothetical protein